MTIGCGGDDGAAAVADASLPDAAAVPTFDLSWSGSGYGRNENGNTLFFALWEDDNTLGPVATTSLDVMGGGGGGGGSVIDLTAALQEGKSYALYWFADQGGSGGDDTCMAAEPNWMIAIPAVTAAVSLTHNQGDASNGDCSKH